MRHRALAVVVGLACAAPSASEPPAAREWAPKLYWALFTQFTRSGLVVAGRWNTPSGTPEVVVGIYGQLDSDETVVDILQPEERSFREQIESLSPEVRSQLEAQYQEPHTVIIHGALQSHVRYSAESLDPETCPAVAEFRVLLRSVPLYQEGTTDPSFIPGRQQFFFAVANVYTKIDVRVPATHPYAKSLAPILARLQACAS